MKRFILEWVLIGAASLLLVSPVAQAQTQAQPPQRPTAEKAQAANEEASAWVQAFNSLTGKQRAEVVRRHIKRSLATLTLTDAQRTLITDYAAKFVTEENYSRTDPAKRAAVQSEMRPAMENARTVLGEEIFRAVFITRPPISDIEAVKNDPAFR